MQPNISYAAPHLSLKHLTLEQMHEIHRRYMAGEKAQDLYAEYEVEATTRQLQTLLPLMTLNDRLCPCCGDPLQQRWASKATTEQPAFCKPCRHKEEKSCCCSGCHGLHIARFNAKFSAGRIPYASLTTKDKILLLAMILPFDDDRICTLPNDDYGQFYPGWNQTVLLEMLKRGLITLSSAPTWLDLDASIFYNLETVTWASNVYLLDLDERPLPFQILKSQLAGDLQRKVSEADEPALISLMRQVAEDVSFAYIDGQMFAQKLDLAAEDRTREVLRGLYEELSLADICAIGWQCAKACGKAYTDRVVKTRRHATALLPGKLARAAEIRKTQADSWKVERKTSQVSRVELILHDLIFGGDDVHYYWPLNRYYTDVVMPRLRSGRIDTPTRGPYVPPKL